MIILLTADTRMMEDTPAQYQLHLHDDAEKLLAPSSTQRKRSA